MPSTATNADSRDVGPFVSRIRWTLGIWRLCGATGVQLPYSRATPDVKDVLSVTIFPESAVEGGTLWL